jgi:hypothetical protein
MRECYTARDTMSLASRRPRARPIVQAPLEDALVERAAKNMPQELSSGQSADRRLSREPAAELEPQARHSRASGDPVLLAGAVLA